MKICLACFALLVLTAGASVGCHTGDDETTAPSESQAAAQPAAPDASDPALESPAAEEPAAQEPVVRAQEPDKQPPVAVETRAAEAQDAGAQARDAAAHAFPPTLSDTRWHKDPWMQQDCMRCHETGVGDATVVKHEGMPEVLLSARCRTCHVQIPGSKPVASKKKPGLFEENAFPPMIPASASHRHAWLRDDCLLCHESGVRNAPAIEHEGMPPRLLQSKCRTCHVQVRVLEATESGK